MYIRGRTVNFWVERANLNSFLFKGVQGYTSPYVLPIKVKKITLGSLLSFITLYSFSTKTLIKVFENLLNVKYSSFLYQNSLYLE